MDLSKKNFSTQKKEKGLSTVDLETQKNINSTERTKSLSTEAPQEKIINQETSSTETLNELSPLTASQAKNPTTDQTGQTQLTPLTTSVTYKKIEAILEDDLAELYFKLDETHRRIFKEEGEKTAHQIEQLLTTGKAVTFKIVALIKHWLSFIPGLNKFFVAQEAKIKTDKIMKTVK